MANDLLTIPEELRIKILSNLDAISLIRCTMTCTSIYDTFKSSSLLEYIVQLHFNGVYTAGKPISQPYSELVEYLQERRQAQMFPKWTMSATLQMSIGNIELGLLPTAGAVNGQESSGVLSKRLKTLSVHQLGVDMSQNLIALIEDDSDVNQSATDNRVIDIHICTILYTTPHRRAQQDRLQFTVSPRDWGFNSDGCILQIARNILSIFLHATQPSGHRLPRVIIWDWVTSDLLFDSSASATPLFSSLESEFTLLDSTYFLSTCETNSGSIQLYELSRSVASGGSTIHLATLHLPSTAPNVRVKYVGSDAGPIEAFPLSHTPFAAHDDDRLHVFTIEYTLYNSVGAYSTMQVVNLFVHQRVFKKYCTQRARSQDLPLDIPWAAWGPPNTKIIHPARIHAQYSGQRTAYGQRVILRGVTNEGDSLYGRELTNSVEVLDFSLAAVLSARGVLSMPPSSSDEDKFPGKLLSSSKISASQCTIFEDDVETHLPCVSFTANLERTYAGFMIYADGIVGLNFTSELLTACLDVYTI